MSQPTQRHTNRLLGYPADARLLIINADDFGMCHAANAAITRSLTEGVVTSTTLMVPCAWAPHAMQWLAAHPDIPFGVHLTAVGDSLHYRWKPISCRDHVSSLVDETGNFYNWDRMAEFFARSAPSMKPAKRSGSGRHLDNAAILQAEAKHVNGRRFHTERRERGADLAPMVGPVVQRLRQTDAHRSVPLEPVVRVDLTKHGVRIDALVEKSRPSGADVLHRSPELRKPHPVRPDEGATLTTRDEEVEGVAPDDVAHRRENRAVGRRDCGVQLRRTEREARIDQPQCRPNMMGKRIVEQRPVHSVRGGFSRQ